ncbi:hypothetical protein BH23ACI1_BH23ACI1_16560 [soil metagenome]
MGRSAFPLAGRVWPDYMRMRVGRATVVDGKRLVSQYLLALLPGRVGLSQPCLILHALS